MRTTRLSRDLHPVAWWVWALGLAAAASFTTNPLVLLTLAGVATVVVVLRRSEQPWGASFRIYAVVALVIVVMRVLFRVLLGGGVEDPGAVVLLHLPSVPLPGWVLGLHLLGDVTDQSVLAGLYDGMRLAAIVLCVGAANSLANPKRLLRSVPAALHEIGTALVVAVTVVPQLADSARRVRAAQALRAGDTRRAGRLRRFLVPVLEDALDRSLQLAAGMDTRGYGRSAGAGPAERRTTGALMLVGLGAICVGVYVGLDRTLPQVVVRPSLAVGVACAVASLVAAGRRVGRTRYRPDPWRWPEVAVMISGVAAGWVMHWVSEHQVFVAYPGLTEFPTVTGAALLGGVLGVVAAAAAPQPQEVGPVPDIPVLVLREVTVRYAEEAGQALAPQPVLTSVDLELDEGELVLVSGPTGSGKSTLLGVVTGLVPRFSGGHLSGDVLLDGVSVLHAPPRERAHVIGYIGQDPLAGFVTDTVEEELAYGMEQLGLPPATMRRRVEETLDILGMADLRRRDLRTLSGGQQQRVAVGSVLTMHPRLLVLDEPTSALDPTAAEEVLATLTRLVHDLGVSVLVAEHRLERVVPFADRMALLDGRGGLTVGPPADLLAGSPVVPPIVELGRAAGWSPLPLSVRDARRHATGLRDRLVPPDAVPEQPADPAVQVRDLTVTHGRAVAVREVTLTLPTGRVTALMGRNGSGKSSLLWTLQGSGARRSGSVLVLGQDPARLRPEGRRELVGLLPQQAADLLYLETVDDELAAGGSACRGILDRLVPGVPGHRHPRDLSEGQRLGLALALVLAADPPVVLLDEPTRGLDYGAKRALAAALRELAARGRAVLVATHDVEFVAQAAQEVVVLADGEVVSAGPVRRVVAESPAFAPQVTKILGGPWLRVDEVTRALATVPT